MLLLMTLTRLTQYWGYLNASKIDSRMLDMSMQFPDIYLECMPIQNVINGTI
jgi:hypothetical protein